MHEINDKQFANISWKYVVFEVEEHYCHLYKSCRTVVERYEESEALGFAKKYGYTNVVRFFQDVENDIVIRQDYDFTNQMWASVLIYTNAYEGWQPLMVVSD